MTRTAQPIRLFASEAKSHPVVLTPSDQEVANCRLSQRSMQTILEAMHADGLVVVQGVVDTTAIDRLNARMVEDTRTLVARGDDGPFNYNLGNLQQSPPNDPDITNAYLGEKPTMSFISSNAAVKAEVGQPVHSDADFDHPSNLEIPFAAVVNVGLIDMHPENGSTQVWLGTQNNNVSAQDGAHGERASGRIKLDLLEKRRVVSPPIQPTVKKGSIVIRDLRLWHAGMPNKTNDVRIMLAMIHFAPWYRQRMTMKLPRALRPSIDGQDRLALAVDWQDEPVDHLDQPFGNAFDFCQDL
ncbi:uncharacterized protein EHS24_000343 [Apiotrichum porosum]|uniref:Phytanoyl-CoA dioxygenase n=1 Tax=Apiotrichum porosum TaxID=105984 RepID=A0A427Y9R8_9TREE|nr:uncharacterized protein EHS24_000343 [Apiotrichum porosum]RSH87826.1 hypothetical protein EHS24_000343 [Apiotrichum porosum]